MTLEIVDDANDPFHPQCKPGQHRSRQRRSPPAHTGTDGPVAILPLWLAHHRFISDEVSKP